MSNDYLAEPIPAPVLFERTPSSIYCGCGFQVVGLDEERNQKVFGSHTCFVEGDPVRWHDNLFSFWGFITAMVLIVTVGILVEEWMAR